MTEAAEGSLPTALTLRQTIWHDNRRLAWWIGGEFISALGDQFFLIALVTTLAETSGALGTGVTLAAGALPRAVLSLFGGVVVDRVGPRRVMLAADGLRALATALASLVVVLDGPRPVVLLVTAVLMGLGGALFEPAATTMAPRLVGPRLLVGLNAIRVGSGRAALLAGAPLAAIAVVTAGVSFAFAVDAASFAISAITIWPLRPASGPRSGSERAFLNDLRAGVRYLLGHPLLRPALLTIATVEFALTGAINAGVPLLSSSRNWGALGTGGLLAIFGLGSILGPLSAPRLVRTRQPGRNSLLATLIGLGCFGWLGFFSSIVPAAIAIFLLGVSVGMLAAVVMPAVQAACDLDMLGRLGGALSFALTGQVPLSLLAAATLITGIGLKLVFVVAAVGAALACLFALGVPSVQAASSRTARSRA